MNYLTILRKAIAAFLILTFALTGLSCKKGGPDGGIEIEGIDGPHIVVEDGYMSISSVFHNIELLGGLRYSIPKYPNSYLEIGPDFETEGTLLSIHIAFSDLGSNDLEKLDPQTLPGGRPLPGVRSGRLPAIAFKVEKFNNIHIYAGNSFFGIFLPMPSLDVKYAILTARFYLDDGSRAGNISLVGQDYHGENAGFLLLLNLKAKLFETSGHQHLFQNLISDQDWKKKNFSESFTSNATCNPGDEGDCDNT